MTDESAGVADRAYDEAIPVETDDEEFSTPASSEAGSPTSAAQKSPKPALDSVKPDARRQAPQQRQAQEVQGGMNGGLEDNDGSESGSGTSGSSTSESGDGEEKDESSSAAKADGPAGAYNPDDYKGLKVSADVEELFQYITRYKPHTIDLETSFKPFIPELIPSIGEVDAFLKMPKPDNEAHSLGTIQLDEPTMNPSDPSILDLQLRSLTKNGNIEPMEVRSIENAAKNPKEVENWARRIDDLNRTKPGSIVQYSRKMPDIEQLMQVWPAEFEEFLQQNSLPDLSELDLELRDLIKIMGSVLDVPVYGQLTETLHVIFTLYSEFKANQHFSKTDAAASFGVADPYNFGAVPAFGQPGVGGPGFFSNTESMAPSRAPSPAR